MPVPPLNTAGVPQSELTMTTTPMPTTITTEETTTTNTTGGLIKRIFNWIRLIVRIGQN